ncbi:MAG: hypothetical protein O3A36_01250 [bacterium]|nr:hypothetical protein [bacterium]
MVMPADFKELIYTVSLIAGLSIAWLIVGGSEAPQMSPEVALVVEKPHAVHLVVNPVVHITVPTHNVFAK